MLIAVASVKSGGCTTVAAVLAAVWPGEQALLVELDAAGGDMGGWHGVADTPGLASLASACRGSTPVQLDQHVTRLRCGIDVVVAAAGRPQASAAIGLLADAEPARWAKERPTVLDLGRLEPGTPALPLLVAADVVLLVARGDVLSLKRVFDAEIPTSRAQLVLVGAPAYRREEITATVGLPLAAQLPWDPRSADVIAADRAPRPGWTRIGLPATMRGLAIALAKAPDPAGGARQ
jgi:hypothetical protein